MYGNLGIHWASSIPAFLALACVPFPFLFYKYGLAIRLRCKFAAESARILAAIEDKSDEDSPTENNEDQMGFAREGVREDARNVEGGDDKDEERGMTDEEERADEEERGVKDEEKQ